ncbi:hypothetical protein [Streptomyces sp. 900105755]
MVQWKELTSREVRSPAAYSIVDTLAGLVPPATGNVNPASFDDGAVARAVPDGVWAAAAMAASIAAALAGAGAAEAVRIGADRIPPNTWLPGR